MRQASIIFSVESRPGDDPDVGWTDGPGIITKPIPIDDAGYLGELTHEQAQILISGADLLAGETVANLMQDVGASELECEDVRARIYSEVLQALVMPVEDRFTIFKHEVTSTDATITRFVCRVEEE